MSIYTRTESSFGAELTCISTIPSACSADNLFRNSLQRQTAEGGSISSTFTTHDGSSGTPSTCIISTRLGVPLLEDGDHTTIEHIAQSGMHKHKHVVVPASIISCGDDL